MVAALHAKAPACNSKEENPKFIIPWSSEINQCDVVEIMVLFSSVSEYYRIMAQLNGEGE